MQGSAYVHYQSSSVFFISFLVLTIPCYFPVLVAFSIFIFVFFLSMADKAYKPCIFLTWQMFHLSKPKKKKKTRYKKMDKKLCCTLSSSSSSSTYSVFQSDLPSPLASPQAGSSSSAASSIPLLSGLEENILNALNERAYQFFRLAKLSYNINYGQFYDHTSLGQKNRKSLGLNGNMYFNFWKQ